MPHGDACADLTSDQDAAIAAEAIAGRDLAHAAIHVAAALGVDPLRADYRALFESWYAAADDPLGLVPLVEGASYSLVCVHAEVRARKGDLGEAFDLLLRAAAVRPDVPFLAWGTEWIVPEGALAGLDPDVFEGGAQKLASALGRRDLPPHPRTIDAALAILERVRAAHPDHIGIAYWHVAALRALARIPEALASAEALYALHPQWRTALAVGMVLRRTDDFDRAVLMFKKALEHDPEDLGCRLDLGDMLCDAGRLDEGLAYYQEVLARNPKDAWALPSSYFFRAVRDRDTVAAEQLRLMTFNEPQNRRAAFLADRLSSVEGLGSPTKKRVAKQAVQKRGATARKKPAPVAKKKSKGRK
jgi:tetratricopeptide (TPR) repeat protein